MNWWVPKKLGSKTLKHTYNHASCRSGNSSTIFTFGGFDGRQALFDVSVINIDIAEVF